MSTYPIVKHRITKHENNGGDLSYLAKKGFQVASNLYRKKFCKGRARPLEMGELHDSFACANFTGPGSRVDLEKVRNYKPFNDIDACSRTHDLDYMAASELPDEDRRKAVRDADIRAIECYNKYPNQLGYTAANMGINGKMRFEDVLPFVAKRMTGKYYGSEGGNLISRKLHSSYSKPILDAINLVIFDEDTYPVGSFSFKSQLYPSDIDLNEKVNVTKKYKDIIYGDPYENAVSTMQDIVKNITNSGNSFLGDFKAGLDDVYFIDINKSIKNIKDYIKVLHDEKYLNTTEYNEVILLLKDKDKLFEFFRNKYVLRWSLDEIKNGYKVLSNNRIKKLSDALKDKTIIKLDAWSFVNNRFIEITNLMDIIYNDKDGNIQYINDERPPYIEYLKAEIAKYMSDKYYNLFKVTKRLWILAKEYKDKKMLEKLTPLIRSDVAILYQVSSDLKLLLDMLDKIEANNLPIRNIYKELDDIKNRLSYVYSVDFKEGNIDKKLDYLRKNYTLNIEDTKIIIEDILQAFSNITNDYAEKYYLQNKIKITGKYV
jgi:hypothetical protein